MRALLIEPFQAGYMRRAIIEVVVLGLLGGVIGVHVLLRRLSFLTEVVQHTVFPGIAIAFAFGQSLMVGALTTGLASVVLLTMLGRTRRVDADAAMAVLFAVFLAVGVVIVSRRRGFQTDLTALLFGRILAVDQRQLVDTLVITALCLAVLAMLHKELVMRAFDETGAEALGYPVDVLDLVLDAAIAVTVVAGIRAMGTVLVIALVVTPAATARLLCRGVGTSMAVAAALGAVGGWAGLVVSYDASVHHGWRLAPGATLVMVLTAGFVVVAAGAALTRRVRAGARRRQPAVAS
jgi:manganese/iron transport system permease protein